MTISFTLHALERMKHRSISKNEVISCIVSPDKLEKTGEVPRAMKKISGKILVVYYKREDENIIIITAYKSSKTHKYLR